jgi:hypothetical protein
MLDLVSARVRFVLYRECERSDGLPGQHLQRRSERRVARQLYELR